MTNIYNNISESFLISQKNLQKAIQPSINMLQVTESYNKALKFYQPSIATLENMYKIKFNSLSNFDNITTILKSYSQVLNNLSSYPNLTSILSNLNYSLDIVNISKFISNRYNSPINQSIFEEDIQLVNDELNEINYNNETEEFSTTSNLEDTSKITELLNKSKLLLSDLDLVDFICLDAISNFSNQIISTNLNTFSISPAVAVLLFLTILYIKKGNEKD